MKIYCATSFTSERVTKRFHRNFTEINLIPTSSGPNIIYDIVYPIGATWNRNLVNRWEIPRKSVCDTPFFTCLQC